jgi:hypothetical protein
LLGKWVILGGLVASAVLGCRHADTREPAAAPCQRAPAAYRVTGKALVGDVDADGTRDRVTLRVDGTRPARCRHVLVVQLEGGRTAVATVPPLPWPGTDPHLLLLAEIDGRPGLEPVITLSPAAVYRPGAVFTLSRRTLLRMRLERVPVPELFPFSDEFPAGVDCAGQPGTIVVTQSRIAKKSDGRWDLTRSFYRVAGARFALVRDERFQVEVGPGAGKRWPEVRGDPFLRCRDRVS